MSDDLEAVSFEELRLLCESLEDDLSDAILIIDRHADCIEELEAKLAKAVDKTLDAANEYMIDEYGISVLGDQIDRNSILAKLKGAQP